MGQFNASGHGELRQDVKPATALKLVYNEGTVMKTVEVQNKNTRYEVLLVNENQLFIRCRSVGSNFLPAPIK